VNIAIGVVEFLLSFRFIFKFFAVNSSAPFVAWLYGITAPLISPFAKIFPDFKLGRFVVDFTTLIALIVYVLASYLLLRIFSFTDPRHMENE